MIGSYYGFLWLKIRRNPTYTIHRVNEIARGLWVASVMNNPSKDVMAVQTLRNFIMGASLMASTATLLIIGTLTLSGQAESIARSWHVLNPAGSHAAKLWIIKVIALLLDFIIAFFFAVPLVFWLFGPTLLILATLGLVITLYHLDRTLPAEEIQ